MPDASGVLTDQEKLAVKKWIDSHSQGVLTCPLCKQNNWLLTDDLVNLLVYTPGVTVIGGPSYPCIQLICKTCGSTQFFNAIMTGIVPADSKPEEPAPQAGEATNG